MNQIELEGIVRRAAKGEKQAIEILYNTYREKLYFFVLKNVDNKDLAEDIIDSKFLVDEKTRTYKLAQQFSLPYSAIVSSVQHLGGNIPFSSGMSKIFGEYDKDGKLIKSFEYEADKYSYRVMKYEF